MKNHIHIYEKVVAIILSFAMIVGLLGGMKLDVRAKERTIDLASYIKDHLGKTIDLGTISGDSSINAEVTSNMGMCYMDGVLVDKRKDDYSTGAGAGSSIQTALNGIRNPGIMSLDLTKIDGIDPQLTYSMQIYGWKEDERYGNTYGNTYHIFLYLSIITIDTLNITVTQPEAGQPLPIVENRGVNVTEGAEVTAVKWDVNIGGSLAEVENGVKAEYNTQYVLNVWVKAKDGYKFGDRVVDDATINGERTRVSRGEGEKGTLWFSKYFPKTASDPAKTINSIGINIDLPVGGKPFPSEVPSLSNATGMIEWMKQGGVRVSGLAKYDTKYIAQIEYEATNGYVFADNVTASVNGEPASFTIIEGTNNKNCLITRTFQTAKEGQAQTVSNIEITVPQPVGGQALPTISDVKQTVTGAKATKILWCEGDNTESKPYVKGNAKYNTVYTMRILYEAEDGYIFDNNTTATVNGNTIKFWITAHSKDKKGEVTYTFPATGAEQTQTISNIAITAPEPVGGQKLPYFPEVTYETTEVRGMGINWYKGTSVSDANAASGTAEYNTVYTMRIRYDAKDGYIFGSDTTASVNGKPEKCELGTDKKVCYVTYTFPATGAEPSGGDYKIIEGNNSNYVPGSDKPLSFRGDGEFNEFLRVEVDGKIVEKNTIRKRQAQRLLLLHRNIWQHLVRVHIL